MCYAMLLHSLADVVGTIESDIILHKTWIYTIYNNTVSYNTIIMYECHYIQLIVMKFMRMTLEVKGW